jgi:hypothetical protein
LKGSYFALLAVGLETAGMFALDPERWDVLRRALIMSGFALALVFAWLNRSWRPMQLLVAGLVLNLIPMLANGGLMPVTPENALRAGFGEEIARLNTGDAIPRSKDVLKERDDTALALLSDTIVLPEPLPGRAVASPGDLLVAGSVGLAVASLFWAIAERTFGGRWPRRTQAVNATRQA